MKEMIQPEALKVSPNLMGVNDAKSVKLDFAPMEGITGYVFRRAHAAIYGGVDHYYSPFIAPGSSHKLTSREKNDIIPEHNQGLCLIPQVLTHSAEDFLWVCEKLAEYGYGTVNLNLGCPSGTVVTKKKGAGFLAEPDDLSLFLEEVCNGLEKIPLYYIAAFKTNHAVYTGYIRYRRSADVRYSGTFQRSRNWSCRTSG